MLKSDLVESLADFKAAAERRDKELHRTIMFATFGIIAAIGVAAALLGLWLRQGG